MKDNNILKQTFEQAWPAPPQPCGSRERFAQRLADARRAERRRLMWGISSAIGVAACIVVAFVMLYPKRNTSHDIQSFESNIHTEIAEVRGYYKALIWSESEYIIELTRDMKPEMREMLLKEIKVQNESPDSIALKIMCEDIDDDQKVAYITSVYMAHLRCLQYIHQTLCENKQAYMSEQ